MAKFALTAALPVCSLSVGTYTERVVTEVGRQTLVEILAGAIVIVKSI